jgi:hypothetical protein
MITAALGGRSLIDTCVLIFINKRYSFRGAGIKISAGGAA